MTDALIKLRELAADCRVRVGHDIAGALQEGGSGVWIAPGTALTCAHVVPAGRNSKVEIGWRDCILTGTVTDHIPDTASGNLWPYPDLAVVVVDDAPEHPCAWLSEAVPAHDLVVFGHSAELSEGLQEADVEGWRGGSHAFGQGKLWQFKGNKLGSGMSGGLVLDLSSGAVCGIANIGEDADRGGYVVPVEGLRHLDIHRRRELLTAHDQFHGRDRRWTALRAGLPALPAFSRCLISPDEEVELLHLLAQLPTVDPAELLTLVARSTTDDRVPAPPGALRDVAYSLLDSGGRDSELVMSVLRMIHHLVGGIPQPAHLDLYDWATALAARRHREDELRKLRRVQEQKNVHGGVIFVEIVPGAAKVDRYRLTVSVHRHQQGRQPIYQDKEPVHSLDQVKQVTCEQLRIALGWLGGNARVEFVIPIELFDEPFDELVPTKPYTNLGRKHCVVLRDYDRQFDPLVQHDWHERWQQLQLPSRGIRWITCSETLTPDEFSAELEQHPETAIVGLTRRPSSNAQVEDMLRVALDSGMPVVVWCRDTCSEHDANVFEPDCSGQRFQTAFNPILYAPELSNLPETVRQLRNKAAMRRPDHADHNCRGTVLLWDEPAQTTQSVAPVHEPPYLPLENSQ